MIVRLNDPNWSQFDSGLHLVGKLTRSVLATYMCYVHVLEEKTLVSSLSLYYLDHAVWFLKNTTHCNMDFLGIVLGLSVHYAIPRHLSECGLC